MVAGTLCTFTFYPRQCRRCSTIGPNGSPTVVAMTGLSRNCHLVRLANDFQAFGRLTSRRRKNLATICVDQHMRRIVEVAPFEQQYTVLLNVLPATGMKFRHGPGGGRTSAAKHAYRPPIHAVHVASGLGIAERNSAAFRIEMQELAVYNYFLALSSNHDSSLLPYAEKATPNATGIIRYSSLELWKGLPEHIQWRGTTFKWPPMIAIPNTPILLCEA